MSANPHGLVASTANPPAVALQLPSPALLPAAGDAPDGLVSAARSQKQTARSSDESEHGCSSRAATPSGSESLHTRPILTPQFHWNLNAHATASLSEPELAQVYNLFRFYDSSTTGDALPSISCRRLLQALYDARLVTSTAQKVHGLESCPPTRDTDIGNNSSENGYTDDRVVLVHVSDVEQLFAEAVMGKMRTHVDADAQPVLTFPLFCGALLNCATRVYPALQAQPAVAFRKLCARLLSATDEYAAQRRHEHAHNVERSDQDECSVESSQQQQRRRDSLRDPQQSMRKQQQQSTLKKSDTSRSRRLDARSSTHTVVAQEDDREDSIQHEQRRVRPLRSSLHLLQHFPADGTDALWFPSESNGAVATTYPSSLGIAPNADMDSATSAVYDERSSADDSSDMRYYYSRMSFQHVRATFSADVALDARARERSRLRYEVPPALAAQFSADHLRLVVERFRVFDVNDRGALPRYEILPLLTALVKKLEIADMYDVLALLLTGERAAHRQSTLEGAAASSTEPTATHASAGDEITLHDVLLAIQTCRRSRTAPAYGNGNTGRSDATSASKAAAASNDTGTMDGANDTSIDGLDVANANGAGRRRSSVARGSDSANARRRDSRPAKKASTKPKANKSPAAASKRSLTTDLPATQMTLQRKHSIRLHDAGAQVLQKTSAASVAIAEESSLPRLLQRRVSRRTSKLPAIGDSSACPSDEPVVPFAVDCTSAPRASTETPERPDDVVRDPASSTMNDVVIDTDTRLQHDRVRAKMRVKLDRVESKTIANAAPTAAESTASSASRVVQRPSNRLGPIAVSPANTSADRTADKADRAAGVEQLGPSRSATSSALHRKQTTLRVFMLLGGEHDGAICCCMELTLPARRLEETRGIFYLSSPHDVRERSLVLPVQPDAESALLMMQRRVQQREREGYMRHPPDQIDVLARTLARIRERTPHYRSAISHSAHGSSDTVSSRHYRSLEHASTRVRQGSASDLRVELSDSRLNESLKTVKRAAMHADNNSVVSGSSLRRGFESAMTATTSAAMADAMRRAAAHVDDAAWIHAVNNAAHSHGAAATVLRTSVSEPLLPGSRASKPHV